MLGVEHHLLISPLGRKLGICRIKISARGTWIRLRLLLLLEKRRVEGRRSYVGRPAAMWLLLNRIRKGLLLLRCQQHLLLLLKQLLLLLLEMLLLLLLVLELTRLLLLLLLLAVGLNGGGRSLLSCRNVHCVVPGIVEPVRSCQNGHGLGANAMQSKVPVLSSTRWM